MRTIIQSLTVAALGLTLASAAHAASDWTPEKYDLRSGDFNGDGRTDILYLAKDTSLSSGIVLADESGMPVTELQSWSSQFLGISWSEGLYSALVADFSGDGKADVFLQRRTSGEHYLLFSDSEGKLTGIHQAIPDEYLGLAWSAEAHALRAGDVNGDGRADLVLQSAAGTHLNAIVLADDAGHFTTAPAQSWNNDYLGFEWAQQDALLHVGDFNGDGRSDLLLQAFPESLTGEDGSGQFSYPPNMNGVVVSLDEPLPFQITGFQSWSRDGFGVDWSPNTAHAVVADFSGDGLDDVLLQALVPGETSYLLQGQSSGPVFSTPAIALPADTPSAEESALLAADFDGDGRAGLYLQGTGATVGNRIAQSILGRRLVFNVDSATLATGTSTSTAGSGSASAISAGDVSAQAVAASSVVAATAVGRTVGSYAVSPTGAATYSIPIVVPPGVAGMQPGLAISYQSGAGNGQLGVGWGLDGLSEIERCKKTLVQDNSNDAVKLTTADRFCLDGNKLRTISGTYGAAGSVYQTELEQFSRITAYGTAGNGPAYFIVEARNGLKYEYGNSADSRIESLAAGYTTTPHTWALNKVSDRHGNTMTVTYQEDGSPNGSFRPLEINYTSNSGASLAASYKVKFVWETRPAADVLTGYLAGGLVKETYRLDRIETQYKDPSTGAFGSVRAYELDYATSSTTSASRLVAVQECGRDGSCLPATTISWQDGTSGLGAVQSGLNLGSLSAYALPIDVNGDGRADLVYPSGSTWYYALMYSSGLYGAATNTSIAHNNKYSNAFPIDYNADGRTDLLVPNASNQWQVLQSTGSGFTVISTGIAVPSITSNAWAFDYDGDGRQDLMYVNGTPQSLRGRRNLTTGFSSAETVLFQPIDASIIFNTSILPSPYDEFRSILDSTDFNGDGRVDLLVPFSTVYGGSWGEVLLSTGAGFISNASFAFTSLNTRSVDLNGDGLTDVAYACSTGTTWCVRLGTGAGVGSEINTGRSFSSNVGVAIFDWDGDGRGDLLQGGTSGNWTLLRGTNDVNAPLAAPVDSGIPATSASATMVADVNGDGMQDLVYSDASNVWNRRLRQGVVADLVSTITDGFGNSVATTYAPLTDSTVYTKGTGAAYPLMDLQVPLNVVKQYTASNGIGSTYNVSYTYNSARVHLTGRGFLGFASRTETNTLTGIKSTWNYRQDFPFIGAVSSASSVQSANNKSISATTSSYTDLVTGSTAYNDRHYPYLSGSVQTSYEVNAADAAVDGQPIAQVTTAVTGVDTYGNPGTVTETTADQTGSGQSFSTTTASTYNNDATNWCLGFVTNQTVTRSAPGTSNVPRSVQFVKDTDLAK